MDNTNQLSSVKNMIDELLTDNHSDELLTENKDGEKPMNAIQLSGECTIYEIMQLHQQIHDNWPENTGLELDVSGVTEVDASFIQLLATCKNTARNKHLSFQLKTPSEPLNNKINAMFMQDFFFKDDDLDNDSSDQTADA